MAAAPKKTRWARTLDPYPEAMSHYVLAWRRGSDLRGVMPMPNGPSRLSITEQFASSIDFTLGSQPRREHSEPRSWSITISGRSGTAPRPWYDTLPKTEKKQKPDRAMEPLAILEEFNEFLNAYQRDARDSGNLRLSDERYAFEAAPYTHLRFHAFKENKHFAVEIVKFVFDRDAASSRNSAEWALVLEGWEDLTAQQHSDRASFTFASGGSTGGRGAYTLSEDEQKDLRRSKGIARLLGRKDRLAETGAEADVREALTKRAAAVLSEFDSIATTVRGSGLAAFLFAGVWFDSEGKGIQRVMAQVRDANIYVLQYVQVATDVARALEAVRSTQLMPLATLGALVSAAGSLRESLKALHNTPAEVLAAAEAAYCDALTWFGLSGGSALFLQAAAVQQNTPLPGVHAISGLAASTGVPATDVTLFLVPPGIFNWKALSQHLYGDPGFWLSLALLNNAKDASSQSSGAPLQAGVKVLVPSGINSGVAATGDVDAMFGVDLLEGPDGDWVYAQPAYQDTAGTGTDIKRVSGVANLTQALVNRMTTKLGQVKSFPDYGMLTAGPGDAMTDKLAAWAVLDIQEQLLKDVRVVAVRDVRIQFVDSVWQAEFDVIPAGPQPDKVSIIAPF